MNAIAEESGVVRCFVAVNLPPDVKEIVAQRQALLRSHFEEAVFKDSTSSHRAVRWVQPELVHLTLLFLGDVSHSKLGDAQITLESACAGINRFELRLSDWGVFPNAQRPRVIWTGLDGDVAALEVLQRRVSDVLRPFVAKPEAKKFRPHLTLARIKSEDKFLCRRIGEALSTAPSFERNTNWQVDSVELMRSKLTPAGPEYSALHSVRLGGN